MGTAPRPESRRISAVARHYHLHPQTLRTWEREGLLKPSRSSGNTRIYNDIDLDKLEVILHLTRELGVNLAGVEVILHMRRRLSSIRHEADKLAEMMHRKQSGAGAEKSKALTRVGLVRSLQRLSKEP